MTTKILTLTLLATTLTLSAAIPQEERAIVKQKSNFIATHIANTLYKRGIEKNKAQELASKLSPANNLLFSMMIHNFTTKTKISHNTLLHELSTFALTRQKVDFTSYSFLVKLSHSLKNEPLNKKYLTNLSALASINSLLQEIFA